MLIELAVVGLCSSFSEAEERLQDLVEFWLRFDEFVDRGARCLLRIPAVLSEALQNSLRVL